MMLAAQDAALGDLAASLRTLQTRMQWQAQDEMRTVLQASAQRLQHFMAVSVKKPTLFAMIRAFFGGKQQAVKTDKVGQACQKG